MLVHWEGHLAQNRRAEHEMVNLSVHDIDVDIVNDENQKFSKSEWINYMNHVASVIA